MDGPSVRPPSVSGWPFAADSYAVGDSLRLAGGGARGGPPPRAADNGPGLLGWEGPTRRPRPAGRGRRARGPRPVARQRLDAAGRDRRRTRRRSRAAGGTRREALTSVTS